MKLTRPTPEKAEWLKNNYRLYTNRHLADKLNIPEARLTHWLQLLGLRKRKEVRKLAYSVPKKKIKNKGPEPTVTRLKADHTNVSREQHVERILKMEL
jgi:hypothetical protein